MSVKIVSDNSADEVRVGTNKASRAELYDPDGNAIYRLPNGSYLVTVLYTGGTDASGTFVWAMRNGSSRIIVVRRVYVIASFNGTAAASTQDVELVLVTGITGDSGGTVRTPAAKKTAWPSSTTTSVRDAGAITLTSGAVGKTFGRFGVQRQVSANGQFDMNFPAGNSPYAPIEIDAGTGNALALRLNVAAVAGDGLRGYVEWDER